MHQLLPVLESANTRPFPDAGQAKPGADSLDALRRRLYAIALLVGFAAAAINLFFNIWILQEPDLFQLVYLPILAAGCLFLAILLPRGRQTQRLVEWGMCLIASGSLLSRLYYGLYVGNPNLDTNAELSVLTAWFPLIYILYYLILDGRRAAWLAWLSYAGVILLTVPYSAGHMGESARHDEFFVLLQFLSASPLYIVFLTVLSAIKQGYSNAQTHAASMTQLALYDALTGLRNRRCMEENLPRLLARAQRENTPVGVIMLDIDHFKLFNDTFGHEGGDAVLRAISDFLTSRVRVEDIVCRFGGEEFIVILPGTDLEKALWRAEQFRVEAASLKVKSGGQPLGSITLSLGVAVFPDHGAGRDEILQAADTALYQSKQAGRDCVTIFSNTR